jgi:hypothetical protein
MAERSWLQNINSAEEFLERRGLRALGHKKAGGRSPPPVSLNLLKQTPSDAVSPDHAQRHMREAGKTNRAGGGGRQVDDAAANEWPPIIDAHDYGTAVAIIGHPHHGAEWQRAMRRRQAPGARVFAVGSSATRIDRRYSGLCRGSDWYCEDGRNKS